MGNMEIIFQEETKLSRIFIKGINKKKRGGERTYRTRITDLSIFT